MEGEEPFMPCQETWTFPTGSGGLTGGFRQGSEDVTVGHVRRLAQMAQLLHSHYGTRSTCGKACEVQHDCSEREVLDSEQSPDQGTERTLIRTMVPDPKRCMERPPLPGMRHNLHTAGGRACC